jgi:hypothetical protein
MAMPAQPTEWNVEMVRALPDDGNRYEVIGGELFVTPSPSLVHQRAVIEMLERHPDRDIPPLVIDLATYFDRVHGIA